ncbi:hypothetical protein [Actinotalea subterranea]|uniref:hypothetical protein n=1 Tax=Actinotalea subterranea TaxID=2607497 RepID=UPI0011EE868A|nr:hypothetical protein [Actinotalea subterranea]
MASSIEQRELPTGSRGWRSFVEGLAQVDDTAETHWLEMKRELDLSRSGAAKIAKFILGAANRLPEAAANALEGHAVMVLGVAHDALVGVEPVEDLELEQRLTPFLGTEGPRWDTQRVGVADGRDVLVIVVDAPKAGDPIYVCRKDGDGVSDGDVYVRARGETRRAKSGELDLLRARERSGVPSVELEVAVSGPVRAYVCDPEAIVEYVGERRQVLLDRLPKPSPPTSPLDRNGALAAALSAAGGIAAGLTVPEKRTEAQYRDEVARWAAAAEAALPTVVDALVAVHGQATTFVVRNLTTRYLSDVRLELHLAGAVEQVECDAAERFFAHDHLPREPRPWGPREAPWLSHSVPGYHFPSLDVGNLRPSGGPSASFTNGGSVTGTFEMPELRPKGSEEFGEEVVLVVRDPKLTALEGSWKATARDHHAVFQGSLVVPVDPPLDVSGQLRSALRRPSK